jgi:hypothetical protein
MEIIKGINKQATIICFYGVAGLGKSTLASMAPNPLFIDLEGGIDRIDCHSTPKIQDKKSLQEALGFALESKYDTIVIDTLSAWEEICSRDIIAESGKPYTSLADFPYGTGFEALKAKQSNFMTALFRLKDSGKNVITIAHEAIETINNPLGENYDRYTLALHKKSIPLIVGKMDAVFYCAYEKVTKELETSKKIVAKDTGRRVLYSQEKSNFLAKNRFNLPEKIDISTPEAIKQLFIHIY